VLRPTHLLAIGGLVVIALLYWKPLHAYEHTKSEVARRQAQVIQLSEQEQQLQTRLTNVGTGEELIREARQLGLVKPGEQLFIVRGIEQWRKHR
jgi:cell division protein FtsB